MGIKYCLKIFKNRSIFNSSYNMSINLIKIREINYYLKLKILKNIKFILFNSNNNYNLNKNSNIYKKNTKIKCLLSIPKGILTIICQEFIPP